MPLPAVDAPDEPMHNSGMSGISSADRIATSHGVPLVAGDEPRDHEDAEENVAERVVARVLEALGNLSLVSTTRSDCAGASLDTNRKEQVHHVHDNQDEVADPGEVIAVARRNEGSGDDVVTKHLPVVLATLLDVDDDDLLFLRQNF